jgi:hypothetical protein
MEFGVLGPLQVVDGDHIVVLGGPEQRAVPATTPMSAGSRSALPISQPVPR